MKDTRPNPVAELAARDYVRLTRAGFHAMAHAARRRIETALAQYERYPGVVRDTQTMIERAKEELT